MSAPIQNIPPAPSSRGKGGGRPDGRRWRFDLTGPRSSAARGSVAGMASWPIVPTRRLYPSPTGKSALEEASRPKPLQAYPARGLRAEAHDPVHFAERLRGELRRDG